MYRNVYFGWAAFCTKIFQTLNLLSHMWVICCREITYYIVKKGVNFTTNLEKQETDLTADMINRSVRILFAFVFCVVTIFLQMQCDFCHFTILLPLPLPFGLWKGWSQYFGLHSVCWHFGGVKDTWSRHTILSIKPLPSLVIEMLILEFKMNTVTGLVRDQDHTPRSTNHNQKFTFITFRRNRIWQTKVK